MEIAQGLHRTPRHVWRIPPAVSQRTAILPDGNLDPDAESDCGEACLSSVIAGQTGVLFSPGCIRQALGTKSENGLTDGGDLSYLLGALRFHVRLDSPGASEAWAQMHMLRRVGHYAIVLGFFAGPVELHWIVAYGGHRERVWVMDPWEGAHRSIVRAAFEEQYSGDVVLVG